MAHDPTTPEERINNPRKNGYLAAALGLLAIVGGVFAMVEPMNQRIDVMEQRHQEALERMKEINLGLGNRITKLDDQGTRAAVEKLSAMQEKFNEVQFQFEGARELTQQRFSAIEFRVGTQERDGNPRHDERIKSLERSLLFKGAAPRED